MFYQIRKVLLDDGGPLNGDIEVDETYFGGKAKNMHKAKRDKLGGRGTAGETAVFGMVERGGRVRAKVVSNVDGRTLVPEIRASVPEGAAIISDGMSSYDDLAYFGYQHDGSTSFPGRLRAGQGYSHKYHRGLLEPVEMVN